MLAEKRQTRQTQKQVTFLHRMPDVLFVMNGLVTVHQERNGFSARSVEDGAMWNVQRMKSLKPRLLFVTSPTAVGTRPVVLKYI